VAAASEPLRAPTVSEDLDAIVAVVDDDLVMQSELDQRLRITLAQLKEQGREVPSEERLRREVLERIVTDRLQLRLAAQNGITVDDAQLDQALGKIAEQNGLGLPQFREVLEREGFAYERFREDLRSEMVIARLQQQVVGKQVEVADAEVDSFLESEGASLPGAREYRLAHILIALPENASSEQVAGARRKAEEVLAQLRSGADFAALAKSVSDAEEGKQGGDLGWRNAARLPAPIAEPLAAMQPGELTQPIRSASGLHLIKLLEVRGGTAPRPVAQYRVRHILVRTDARTSQGEARSQLERIAQRIAAGENFAELARTLSQDPGSAVKGGDLGWVKPGTMVPQFEAVMAQLAPGQVSPPFKTRFGWHVLEVLERRELSDGAAPRRDQAKQVLRERKFDEELEAWLRRLRDEAYVEYRLGAQ
jgi:peptidyl-prolyl cis-trans isomerase SurA